LLQTATSTTKTKPTQFVWLRSAQWREVSPTETNEITYLSDDEKNIQTRSQTKPLDGQFAKGDLIKARYKGRSKWYTGKIDAVVNSTGMLYNVRYDDGDLEKNGERASLVTEECEETNSLLIHSAQ